MMNFNALRISFVLVFALSHCAQANFPFQFRPKKGLTCERIPVLMEFMASKHISVKKHNRTLQKRAIDEYLKMLDGSKTLLLSKDVKQIRSKLKGFFNSLKKGKCDELEEVRKITLARAGENEAFIRKFMGPKYKFSDNVEIVTDPDKRKYPRSDKEKQSLLQKFAHFQMSNYLLADTEEKEAKKLLTHRYELITKRIKEQDQDKLYAMILKAYASAFDPHTSYFSPDDFEDFQINMKLSLEGIGASLSSQDGFTVVEEIIAGGAADKANVLMPKDKIVAVTQIKKKGKEKKKEKSVNVIDMELKDVVRLIRGPKGTDVLLTIVRKKGKKTERLEVAITRDKINLEEQAAKLSFEERTLKGGRKLKLGILDLPSFYGSLEGGKRSSYKDVKKLLGKAKKEKVDGILLNLKQNGGGLLEGARLISGLFIKKGGVVATKDTAGNVKKLVDTDEDIAYNGPLVLLTSRASASAAEILAGALKDYKRALVVGADRTFGKGSVQQVEPFAYEMGAVKITTALFFLPGGKSTQHSGVSADVVIPSALQTDKIGEHALDYSLPTQTIEAFLGKEANSSDITEGYVPVSRKIAKKLSRASKSRIAKDKDFDEVREDIKEADKDDGIIRLSDFRKKAEEDKKKEGEKKKTAAQRRADFNAPYIKEGLNVLSDLVIELDKIKPAAR